MELATIETSLKEIQAEIVKKIDEHRASSGAKSKELENRINELQRQADAIDASLADRSAAGGRSGRDTADLLKESDAVGRFMAGEQKSAVVTFKGDDYRAFERKTTITSDAAGRMTSGVLAIDRIGGIVEEARETLTVRSLLTSRPTLLQVVDFIKVNSPMSSASPQVEASAKHENAVTFTTESERVRTLATWIPATKQVMDDFSELAAFIDSSLRYYVNLEEETQLLSGSGLQEDLNGLITQATAFDTNLLSGPLGWTRLDIVACAIEQLSASKEIPPNFIVMNPADWYSILRLKDGENRYILGNPASVAAPRLWGLSVIVSTSISSGTFLVGSSNPASAEIRDRQLMTVELSREHSDYFTKNMIAIRAEKRLALVVKRPASFITGTFTTSPAS